MKFDEVISSIFFLSSLIVLVSPIGISFITGNHWYWFLFLVSWIPAVILAQIGDALSRIIP